MLVIKKKFFHFFVGAIFLITPLSLQAEDIAQLATQKEVDQGAMNTEYEIDDPFEYFNRPMFEINYVLDTFILDPVANFYRIVMPNKAQEGVSNFLDNLWSPINVANDILQGNPEGAVEGVFRFVINTTLGFFGLFDVASEMGLEKQKEDFGQTLGSWGVGSGPYLVLPLIGPTSARGAVGKAVDYFGDPTNYVLRKNAGKGYVHGRTALATVSSRAANIEDYDALKKTSVDLYATVRSLYAQYRYGLIHGDKKDLDMPGPETFIGDDDF